MRSAFANRASIWQAATVAGILTLWLLLAGEFAPVSIAEGLAVAVAASVWARLVGG